MKRRKAEFLLAKGHTLALYKSLKAIDVPVELTPRA